MTTGQTATQSQSQQSAGVAYLLWFFLGGFGAHRFYCGKKGSGFGMLGLFVGSILLSPIVIGLLGFPVLAVWWLVDAFLINNWINQPQPQPQTTSQVAGTVSPQTGHAPAGTPASNETPSSQAA